MYLGAGELVEFGVLASFAYPLEDGSGGCLGQLHILPQALLATHHAPD